MRQCCILSLLLLLFAACSPGSTEEEKMLEDARAAAEVYYNFLINGDYTAFLNGRTDADSLPESYKEQLLTGYEQFMEQQRAAHEGVNSVLATTARRDTTLQLVQVFLVLQFADSTQEELVVPMTQHHGEWRMK